MLLSLVLYQEHAQNHYQNRQDNRQTEDLLANDRELLIMSHLLRQSEAYLFLGQMFLAVSQLDVIHRFYSVLIKCKYLMYDVFQYH